MRNVPVLIILVLASIGRLASAQSVEPRIARDREFREGAWLEPDLQRGAELYETCAACHGPDGRGTDDGEIPAIAGQHGSVLLKQLTDFRHEQRWNERMRSCERCHGPLGQGNLLLNRPRLAGQHYAYLLRQLQETADNRRPGMGRTHVDMLRQVSPEEMRGVADYLSRVSPDLSSVKR